MRRVNGLLSACLRTVVLLILYVAVRLTWSVRLRGLVYDSSATCTYFAVTHKRDFDSMAPIPPILLRRGWRAVAGDVRFAMRSDSFTRGFLARVVRRPAWFVRVLRPFSVRPVVRGLGVMPLHEVRMRPLEEWLRDCLLLTPDAVAANVLTPPIIAELAAAAHMDASRVAAMPLARLLRWRFHPVLIRYMAASSLIGEARRLAERTVAERARRSLAAISAWLQRGGSIYSAPEGKLSPDGHLSRITSGFHRVLRDAPTQTRVVPISVVYDYMTTGRPRMVISLAPAIEQAPTLPRTELNDRLRRAWMSAACYTCTQLASGYLVQAHLSARPVFAPSDLAQSIALQARALHAAGRAVDARLLTQRGARGRVRRYLAFAAHAGCVERVPGGRWRLRDFAFDIDVPHGEVGYRTSPLIYAWNELRDMGLPPSGTEDASADERTA